jgi:MinD-like ATPase involved in chromosome partitioning or flagellar assembly
LPSVNSGHPLRIRVGPIIGSAGLALLSLLLWVAASIANPFAARLQGFLNLVWFPAVVLAAVMVVMAVGTVALLRSEGSAPEARVEPLLPRPLLPPSRRDKPLVSLHRLEAAAGASSLCFNLGVLLAAEGIVDGSSGGRRPRPICLLEAGRLSARLNLDPQPLTDYLSRNPASIGEEILNLAERHPTGLELLSISEGAINGQRLRLLVPVLRKHYDVILLDCPSGDRWLAGVAVELSELVLVAGLPTRRSAAAAAGWADEAWRRGWEGRSAVVVNRVGPDVQVPEGLLNGFLHQIQIPEDPSATAADAHGLPWSLAFNSLAARELHEAARAAFGQFLPREGVHAA